MCCAHAHIKYNIYIYIYIQMRTWNSTHLTHKKWLLELLTLGSMPITSFCTRKNQGMDQFRKGRTALTLTWAQHSTTHLLRDSVKKLYT